MSGEVAGAVTPVIMLLTIVFAPPVAPATVIPAAEKPTVLRLATPLILFLATSALVTPPASRVGRINTLSSHTDTDAVCRFVGRNAIDTVFGNLNAVFVKDNDTDAADAVARNSRKFRSS